MHPIKDLKDGNLAENCSKNLLRVPRQFTGHYNLLYFEKAQILCINPIEKSLFLKVELKGEQNLCYYRPRSEGDNVLGSVRPSDLSRLNRVQQRAKKSHYQSTEFVCVSNCRADVVDRFLISQLYTMFLVFRKQRNDLTMAIFKQNKCFSF